MLYLQNLLKSKLTARQWEALPDSMNLTKTRTSQMLNKPETMDMDEISRLVGIIDDPEITSEVLINDYHCGWDSLYPSEVEELICQPGESISIRPFKVKTKH